MADNTTQTPPNATSGTLIYQQIEQDADYYLPSIYQSRLTYHHSLELQTDSMGQQFIPVSDAINNPDQKKKLFVVGLIPPSSKVSGILLDRSNSVATLERTPNDPATISSNDQLSNRLAANDPSAGTIHVPGTPGTNQGPPVWTQMSVKQMAVAIRDAYVQNPSLPQPPNANVIATLVGQSIRETSGRWPNYNPGFIGNFQNGDARLNNLSTFGVWENNAIHYYVSYNTPQDGAAAFVNAIYRTGGQAAIQAAANGDVQTYCQSLHDGGYFTATVDFYAGHFPNVQNLSSQIGDPSALNASILPNPLTLGPKDQVDPSTSTSWASQGSNSASLSVQMGVKGANQNLNNTTNTGYAFQQQQKAMIRATQQLLQQMANTPPLQLIVNPQTFKINSEKIVSDGNWTRYGPADVIEHWGENQDKLEGSGKIAAFQAVDMTTTNGGPGLTRTARQYSASYQNFLSLYQLYKNNAGLFLTDNVEPTDTKKQNMSVVGSIYIYYDHTLYIGSFDNFTITETDGAPFTLEYSFSFTLRATFTLDQVSDPNYTYNIPQGGFTTQQTPSVPTTQAATLSSGQPPSNAETAGNEAFYNAFGNGASVEDANAARLNAVQNVLVGGIVPGNAGGG